MELAKAKADYALEVTKAEPTLTMMAVGEKVVEKFGRTLAPYKLREAFLKGGGTIQPRRRRRADKPRLTVESSPVQREQAIQSNRGPGRRKADRAASDNNRVLNSLEKHVVVLKSGDTRVHEFGSAEQAKRFVAGKLAEGVAVSAIGFYTRQPLEVNVGI